MKGSELSRRAVLSSIAVAGGAGSLVGSGTGALFTDKETFAENTLQTSENVGGIVNLDVELQPLQEGTGVEYLIHLPDDVNNNPSYVWLRTSACPEPTELADALTVELRVECGGTEVKIADGTLLDVLDQLRTGELLCSVDGEACLQSGETQRLILEVISVDQNYSGPQGPVDFEFEFYGQQCRYESGTENPFGPSDVIAECWGDDRKAISFVAFCGPTDPNPEDIVISDDVNSTDDAGDPTSVDWTTASDVTCVVVKSGNYWTIYDYSDATKTSGVAATDGSDADWFGHVDPAGATASNPCEVAAEKLGDGSFSGSSTKLEYNDGDFEESGSGGTGSKKNGGQNND